METEQITLNEPLKPNKPVAVEVRGKKIALLLVNDNLLCFEGKCTHQGGDLSKGMVEGTTVICPNHHVQFDCVTGQVLRNLPSEYGQATSLRTFKAKLTDKNKVSIEL